MTTKPSPLPLAMLICDSVIEDKKTGKKSVIGMFNSISTPKIPCTHPLMNIFLVLTEGNGEYNISLRCVKLDSEEPIMNLEGRIAFRNPQQIIECNYEISGLKIPVFGGYRFDVYCNDSLMISRKFNVLQAKSAEHRGGDNP